MRERGDRVGARPTAFERLHGGDLGSVRWLTGQPVVLLHTTYGCRKKSLPSFAREHQTLTEGGNRPPPSASCGIKEKAKDTWGKDAHPGTK